MGHWMSRLRARAMGQRGASLTEYALIVALIAVVCLVVLGALGGNVKARFQDVSNALK